MDCLTDEAARDTVFPALAPLRDCLAEAAGLTGIAAGELAALRERAAANVFNLVAVGEFKRGKSSAINALLGADLLPVGVVPLTAIATVLSYGEPVRVEVEFHQGECAAITLNDLADYVTERGNPRNGKDVREVRIHWPSPWLKSGVRLIDTPGIGSIYRHNSDVTYRWLPKADAVLFLLSVDQPVGQAEYEFLHQVREYAGKIFFLINKADLVSAAELTESVAFTAGVIAEAMGQTAPIFPVSARLALEGHTSGDPSRLAQSGFPPFTAALARFLVAGKGQALTAALAKGLLRLVSQARLNAELARASLHTPVEELRGKVAAFARKRVEIEQEKRDFTLLLEAEVRHLVDQMVNADVLAFKSRQGGAIADKLKNGFAASRHLPPRELHATLERLAVDEVRAAWDAFRRDEDERLAEAFKGLCARFSARIDAAVDELNRFSSALFSVPFEAVAAAAVWSEKSRFYYNFWDEPASLKALAGALVLALPKVLGDPLILGRALVHARELFETQAGRVRYDLAQRLDESRNDFMAAMLRRIDATLVGIETAVGQGLAAGEQGAAQTEARARDLDTELARLTGLAERLQALAAQTAGA